MSGSPPSPTKPRMDFIESWRKKARDNLTNIDLAYRAEEMKTARENTFKFDNSIASDPERRYFYGLSQSIELTCETLIARFRAEEQERKRRAQKAQVAQAAEAQAQAWAAAQARAQAGAGAPQAGAAPLFAEVKAEPVDDAMVKMEDIDEDAYDNTPISNEQFLDFGMGTPNTSQDVINLSDDDSDGIPVPIRRPRGLSVKTLNCPRCTATNMNISAFVKHLTDLHRTTPVKEKVAFLCGCSFTGTNYTEVRRHALNCHNTITVIPRGPMQ
ncbi:hypothetical protein PRIPAC_90017 [Pristionchus pacificus]|uniref:Uncharacterized protein n=1 Tax=Pristionchus pacificus TaxID=54126 RepID=A0A2A6CYJ6_PRIPA|nr:hypothetical protein PRIPAC_90017 [Pristionchus pacificus]|eukprot:PDM83245.1 hypothetical protein PRIPAC_34877 [Pristionchus pacificus]